MKTAVIALFSNESYERIRSFNETTCPADLVLVADTGSEQDLARNLLACRTERFQVHQEFSVSPFRFDTYRNILMSLVPKDFDVVISLDFDETLSPGWRDSLEKALPQESRPNSFLCRYFYLDNKFGGFYRRKTFNSRIHSRHGFQYYGTTHEGLTAPHLHQVPIFDVDLTVFHHADLETSEVKNQRYLSMLRQGQDELRWMNLNNESKLLFQSWISGSLTHEQLRFQCQNILEKLRSISNTRNTFLDRYQKEIYRILLTSCVRQGRREEALQLYQGLSENLRDRFLEELVTPPTPFSSGTAKIEQYDDFIPVSLFHNRALDD